MWVDWWMRRCGNMVLATKRRWALASSSSLPPLSLAAAG
jgi:hypothetical protein